MVASPVRKCRASKSAAPRSSSASPNSPWRRSANIPHPTCRASCGRAPTRRRSGPSMPISPRRATSTRARPRSTAAATKYRRASSPRWCWDSRMDLALKPEHKAFADEVRAFARENLSPATREKTFSGKHYDRDDHIVWQQALGKKGWLAYTWPKKYGGPGWDVTQRFLFENVLAEEGAPRIIPFGVKIVGPVIYTFGNDEQKERFLPGIRSSEVSWCQGYSEPGAGSDLANLRTRAVRATASGGDHYIVNGQKTWTSYAHWGDWIFCLVRTNTEAKAQEGISFLLIDMKTPGVTVRPIIMLDGAHAVNDVFLDNVKVPVANLIGKENEGWTYAKFLLANERLGIAEVPAAKRGVGMLRAISDDPSLAEKIADVDLQVQALEMSEL